LYVRTYQCRETVSQSCIERTGDVKLVHASLNIWVGSECEHLRVVVELSNEEASGEVVVECRLEVTLEDRGGKRGELVGENRRRNNPEKPVDDGL